MPTLPAQALLRETVEQPGQVVFQSRQTLRDQDGQTWQVVVFKRTKDGSASEMSLRLVGFPGQVEFQHPAPLVVRPNAETLFTLADDFAEQNPGENVGQYQISDAFQSSPLNGIWELELPLLDRTDYIKVPYFVLQEWQTVLAKE